MSYKTQKTEEAVSPVIGVILMIAITVILAAVIAAFIFGMANDMESPKNVAIVAHKDSASAITFTNYGGKDVENLQGIAITAYGDTDDYTGTLGTAVASSETITATTPGDFGGNNRVVVVATFLDGTTTVLLDTYI